MCGGESPGLPDMPSTVPPKSDKPRRRWRQFSLRSLLLLTLLVAAAFSARHYYLQPFRAQQQALAFFEYHGASIQTVPAGTPWLRSLLGTPDLQHVVRVDCSTVVWTDESLTQVLRLPELKSLIVVGQGFTDEHLQQLAQLRNLRVLIADTTAITDSGLAQTRPELVIHPSQRTAIKTLSYHGSGPRRTRLAGTPQLRNQFGMAHFQIGYGRLHASHASLRNRDMPLVAVFSDVDTLYLEVSRLDDEGFRHVARLKNLRELRLIRRGHAIAPRLRLTGRSLQLLQTLPRLESLHLGRVPFADDDLAHLPTLTRLKTLNLSGTKLSDVGLAPLKALSQLEQLDLRYTQTTAAGVADLQQALPACKIKR